MGWMSVGGLVALMVGLVIIAPLLAAFSATMMVFVLSVLTLRCMAALTLCSSTSVHAPGEVEHRQRGLSRSPEMCTTEYHSSLIDRFFSPILTPAPHGDILKALTTTLVLSALAATSLHARANMELAQKYACTACHAVDKKLLGPAYNDVVKKYAGQKDAVASLSDSIRKGGSGKWGPVPMPAQPTLSDADVKTLATWILGGAK